MTPPEPLPLPTVDPHALELHNDLVGTHRRFEFPLAGEPAALRLIPPPRLSAAGPAAALAFGGRRAWLHLADWSAVAAVRALLDGEPLDRLPPAVQAAVLAAALENDLAALGRVVGAGCRLDAVEPVEALGSDLDRVGLELTLPSGAAVGLLLADAETFALLRDLVLRAPPAPRHPHDDLPMIAGVEIGLTQLTLAELRSLRPLDVVLLDVAAPADRPAGLVRFAPQATWRVALAPGEATFQDRVKLAHWGQETAGEPRVTLVFEQGRIELAAGALARLQPGATAPLVDADQVVIRAAGQVLGTGQPLSLAGRAGVRLHDWRLAP